MAEQGKHTTVKNWSTRNQPRERLLSLGASSLTDAELLAILVRTGTSKKNVLDCCNAILADNDFDLNEISKLSVQQLSKYEGIGKVKAVTILAAIELGKRRNFATKDNYQTISNSEDAFKIVHPLLCDLEHEEVWILLLNNKNNVLATKRISQGGLTGSVADVRIIMNHALEAHATGLILVHNHPSGTASPSNEDLHLTKKVKEACRIFDIPLLDHIIVARNLKYSFADNGIL